jgi:hypothetical protein
MRTAGVLVANSLIWNEFRGELGCIWRPFGQLRLRALVHGPGVVNRYRAVPPGLLRWPLDRLERSRTARAERLKIRIGYLLLVCQVNDLSLVQWMRPERHHVFTGIDPAGHDGFLLTD